MSEILVYFEWTKIRVNKIHDHVKENILRLSWEIKEAIVYVHDKSSALVWFGGFAIQAKAMKTVIERNEIRAKC